MANPGIVPDVKTTSLESRDSIDTKDDLAMDSDNDTSNTLTLPGRSHISESSDLLDMVFLLFYFRGVR